MLWFSLSNIFPSRFITSNEDFSIRSHSKLSESELLTYFSSGRTIDYRASTDSLVYICFFFLFLLRGSFSLQERKPKTKRNKKKKQNTNKSTDLQSVRIRNWWMHNMYTYRSFLACFLRWQAIIRPHFPTMWMLFDSVDALDLYTW